MKTGLLQINTTAGGKVNAVVTNRLSMPSPLTTDNPR
jgi:hypothetical protein